MAYKEFQPPTHVKTGLVRKVAQIKQLEYSNTDALPWYDIEEYIVLTESEYMSFMADPLAEHDWIKDCKGITLVTDPNFEGQYVINTEGYDYARYIGKAVETKYE